jgi:ribonuclease HI
LVFRLDTRFNRLHEELRQAYVDSRPDALAAESLRSTHGITNLRPHLTGAVLPPAAAHASVSADFTQHPLPDDRARWEAVLNYIGRDPTPDSVDYFSTSANISVTDQDLTTAASRMNEEACPGTDGLDAYLIKVALSSPRWRDAVKALISACTQHALWPTIFSDLWLTTIFKGKGLDPQAPSSFRRICVGPRLAAFCESVILVKLSAAPGFSTDLAFGPSQSGFIRGSGPLTESVVIQMLLDNAKRTKNPAAILSLDQSAAFDRVEFLATVEGLVRARASPASVRFICAFLGVAGFNGTPRLLTVPNSGLPPVPLLCGNPQGGSLSPTLYLFSQNNLDDSVPPNTGIQLKAFHPLIPPPPRISILRFADDTAATASAIKYEPDSLSTICNGPRGPPARLGADSAGQGILHAMVSSGALVNPSKSQLFISDGPYSSTRARDKSLPLRSGEVLRATTPLEILGVTYANPDADAPRALAHPDTRGMNRMVRGFGGALGDFDFSVHARRDLLFSVVIPSTTYGTYICDGRTLPTSLESALVTGLRTMTGTPAHVPPRDYSRLVSGDLLKKFLGCRSMEVHMGYHAVLACFQAVRSPVTLLRKTATHELLRAWVYPAANAGTFADKVVKYCEDIDPHPRATTAQRLALEMTPFMAGLLGSLGAVAPPPQAPPLPPAPPRTLAAAPNRCDLYTDGSFLRGQVNRGAFAVFFGPNDPRNYSQGVLEAGITNNRAELLGLLKALEIIAAELPAADPCRSLYTIHTDSMYCRDICTVNRFLWARNNWLTRSGQVPKNLELVKDLHARLSHLGPVVEVRWVRAHAVNAGNIAVDALARAAAEAVRPNAAPIPAPTFRPALPDYAVAKDALRKALAIKYSDGKLPKFVKAMPSLHANAYLRFVAEFTSHHDGANLPGTRYERLCPWCNAGEDKWEHLLVCPSPQGTAARATVGDWPSVRRILANPPAPPRFPKATHAPRIGTAAFSLVDERQRALSSRPPRGRTLTLRAAALRPVVHGVTPPVQLNIRLPWSLAKLSALLGPRGGLFLPAPDPTGNNCLFIAVSTLLQRSGANLGPDLAAFALRLRYTAAAHVLDYPASADPPRLAGRARAVAGMDDKARSRDMALCLRTGRALDASYIPIISSVMGLAFEVLVIDPASAVVAPHNIRFVSSDQGPQYAPVFAGTLALLGGHWYPVAAGI